MHFIRSKVKRSVASDFHRIVKVINKQKKLKQTNKREEKTDANQVVKRTKPLKKRIEILYKHMNRQKQISGDILMVSIDDMLMIRVVYSNF